MKKFFAIYFQFNRAERNGAIVLIFLILIVASTPYWLPKILNEQNGGSFEEFNAAIDDFVANQKAIEESKSNNKFIKKKQFNNNFKKKSNSFNYESISKSVEAQKITPTYFNPNNLPAEKWEAMGFSPKQVNVIKNYEKAGGKFWKKEDVKKLYCINDDIYILLEPYIIIPKTDSIYTEKKHEDKTTKEIIIDINLADTTEFKKLRGIGKTFANRIVKYRKALGGFCHKIQIKEVWGIDIDLYKSIEANLICKNYNLNKININTATIDELKQHPYIDFYVARSIVKYKNSHGNYKAIAEITKSELVHEDLFNKLKPYITTE